MTSLTHTPSGRPQDGEFGAYASNVNGYDASVRGLAFHLAGHELHHLRIVRESYLHRIEAS